MNQAEAAQALGCSVATVSRLRSGDRRPSLPLMQEIKRVLSWSIDDQAAAIERGDYAEMFTGKMDRRRLRRRHRRGRASC
jgi:transcriptional regulator with XRE-family HTH domain